MAKRSRVYPDFKKSKRSHALFSKLKLPEIVQNVSVTEHIKLSDGNLTNASGELEFVGTSEKQAKYVRLGHQTSVEELYAVTKKWGMRLPNFIISVTGGAQDFKMKFSLTKIFRKSLIKVAENTGAWITTGGTNCGVMKHVGKAVQEYAVVKSSDQKVVALGIVPWGIIRNRHQLENKNKNLFEPAQYSHDMDDPRYNDKTSLLDKNHTHFILVDDGSKDKYGTEIDLRTRFESYVAKKSSEKGVKVFIVCVIVQGGPGSLETVYSSLKQGTPVVVVDGSGGWASILGSLYSYSHTAVTDQLVKELMIEQGMTKFDGLNRNTNTVKECIRMKENITLFQVDNEDNIADLDIAILQAILNNPDLKENRIEQLKLALTWDRSDIAHSHILTDDANIAQSDLCQLFLEALYKDKTEFVKLFLDYGLNLRLFLTTQRLVELYKKSEENSNIETLLKKYKKEKEITIETIGKVMKSLMGYTYKSPYSHLKILNTTKNLSTECCVNNQVYEETQLNGKEDKEKIAYQKYFNPIRELFQWCILTNKRQTAMALWVGLWEELPAAVMATRMLKSLAQRIELRESKADLLDHANVYEELATGVLTEFYEKDPDIAAASITRRVKKWGDLTCLETAVKAKCKDFISHQAVQYLLSKIWLGGMEEKTSPFLVIICTVFPPIMPFVIHFDKEVVDTDTETNNKSEVKEPTFVQKTSKFFYAPIVKFWYNVYFYVAFLLLFTYILVFNFSGTTASIFEYILLAWVVCLALDEVKQISKHNHKRVRKRIKIWFQDTWNKMDVLAIVLFGIGFGLRFYYLNAARQVLAVSFIVFCLRILNIFTIHKALGPKLIMVGNMLRDLGFFVFILFVFIFAYGVSSQAILYPNEADFGTAFLGIFSKAYWHIYGELFLPEISYNPADDEFVCTNNVTLIDSGERRCPEQHWIVPVLSAGYLLLANVLLLNLLIAMFSYTFDNLVQNTDSLWKFQRYELIYEYSKKPWLATPLSVVHHISRALTSCCDGDHDNPFSSVPDENDEKKVVLWERYNADLFNSRQKKLQREKLENRVEGISDRIDELASTVDSVKETLKHQKKVKRKVKKIMQQNKEMNEALKWLISALKDNEMVPKVLHKEVHIKAREINYPQATDVKRLKVPDHLVQWAVPWLDYKPPVYTAPEVLGDLNSPDTKPIWADISLEDVNAEAVNLPFNTFDSNMKVNRKSYLGKYQVIDGIPRNPEGRTGLRGRGKLGRYGPNHAADPIVTKWELDDNGDVTIIDGKHVLQFAAIKREDNNEWAIPGGMVDPDEMLSRTLEREFTEEVNFACENMEEKEAEIFKVKINNLFKCHGQEVFRGYCDDPRNTDNAWIETMVYNFHDHDGSILGNIRLKPGDEASGAKWIRLDHNLKLFASHQQFIEKVAKIHNAYF